MFSQLTVSCSRPIYQRLEQNGASKKTMKIKSNPAFNLCNHLKTFDLKAVDVESNTSLTIETKLILQAIYKLI